MMSTFRPTQDGLKAINSLPPHRRPRLPVRLTADGQRALNSLPAHYRPRRYQMPPT